MRVLIGCSGGKPIHWDPLDPSIPNPHVLVVGTSGSGKTQLVKTIIAQIASSGTPLLVFDRHGEYRSLAAVSRRIVDFEEGFVQD